MPPAYSIKAGHGSCPTRQACKCTARLNIARGTLQLKITKLLPKQDTNQPLRLGHLLLAYPPLPLQYYLDFCSRRQPQAQSGHQVLRLGYPPEQLFGIFSAVQCASVQGSLRPLHMQGAKISLPCSCSSLCNTHTDRCDEEIERHRW